MRNISLWAFCVVLMATAAMASPPTSIHDTFVNQLQVAR